MAVKYAEVYHDANQPTSANVYEYADDFNQEPVNELGSVTGGNLVVDDAIFAGGGWLLLAGTVSLAGVNNEWFGMRMRQNGGVIIQSGREQNRGGATHFRSAVTLVRVPAGGGDDFDIGGVSQSAGTLHGLTSTVDTQLLAAAGAPLVPDPKGQQSILAPTRPVKVGAF